MSTRIIFVCFLVNKVVLFFMHFMRYVGVRLGLRHEVAPVERGIPKTNSSLCKNDEHHTIVICKLPFTAVGTMRVVCLETRVLHQVSGPASGERLSCVPLV